VLIRVSGVGHLTALIFVLTLGKKECFQRSRDVGCYLGLRPRRSQSGDNDPHLGITNVRHLLVGCPNHIDGPRGKGSPAPVGAQPRCARWPSCASAGGRGGNKKALGSTSPDMGFVFRSLATHVVLHRVSIRTLCEPSWLGAGWDSVGEVDTASFWPAVRAKRDTESSEHGLVVTNTIIALTQTVA
jgi:hypothetical protein